MVNKENRNLLSD